MKIILMFTLKTKFLSSTKKKKKTEINRNYMEYCSLQVLPQKYKSL